LELQIRTDLTAGNCAGNGRSSRGAACGLADTPGAASLLHKPRRQGAPGHDPTMDRATSPSTSATPAAISGFVTSATSPTRRASTVWPSATSSPRYANLPMPRHTPTPTVEQPSSRTGFIAITGKDHMVAWMRKGPLSRLGLSEDNLLRLHKLGRVLIDASF